jgi:hypothetical protein
MTENANDEEVPDDRPNPDVERRSEDRGGGGGPLGVTDLHSAVLWGALALLALLSAYSLFQFYAFSSAAIDEWVGDGYRELFQAGFNLAVLLASAAGVAVVVRRLAAKRTAK